MRKVRFAERVPDRYERGLDIALQVECEDNNECFHDHYYLSNEQFKQLVPAYHKFQVERTSDSRDTTVSDGSNSGHRAR